MAHAGLPDARQQATGSGLVAARLVAGPLLPPRLTPQRKTDPALIVAPRRAESVLPLCKVALAADLTADVGLDAQERCRRSWKGEHPGPEVGVNRLFGSNNDRLSWAVMDEGAGFA